MKSLIDEAVSGMRSRRGKSSLDIMNAFIAVFTASPLQSEVTVSLP